MCVGGGGGGSRMWWGWGGGRNTQYEILYCQLAHEKHIDTKNKQTKETICNLLIVMHI